MARLATVAWSGARAMILALVLLGCTLTSLDDLSNAGASSSAGAGAGGHAGSGGAGGSGGMVVASAASASIGAGGAGGGMCAGPLECWWGPPITMASEPCGAPAIADCVPRGWDYCACAGHAPAVFLELDDVGQPLAVTLIAPARNEPYTMAIDGAYCVDAPETSCATTCPDGYNLYRWTDFQGHSPSGIEIWWNDTGPPCDGSQDDGGTLFAIPSL